MSDMRSDGSPIKGWLIRDDECGYDETLWVASHEQVFGNDVESWLAGLTARTRASEIARGIVRESRKA
jgi:hypothetical protein